MVALQVAVALPFLMGETSISDYLSRSKLNGAGRDEFAFAEKEMNWLTSEYGNTKHWLFLSEEFYKSETGLAAFAKSAIQYLNVYYFFFRQGGFKQCIINLDEFLSGKPDKQPEKIVHKHLLDILVVGYYIGIVLLPGFNYQFDLWHLPFMPLFIDMAGLPQWCTFWVFNLYHHPGSPVFKLEYKHPFLLLLTAYHLVFGPRHFISK